MPLLEHDVDIRPGFGDVVLDLHELVVEHHEVHGRDDQQDHQNDRRKLHGAPLVDVAGF